MTLPNVVAGNQNTRRIPSLTYKFDQATGRIMREKIDGTDAIKQFSSKTMQTKRYHNLIYSFFYGSEIETLIGKQPDVVITEINRMIKESLIYDDRITNIIITSLEVTGDELDIRYSVESIFGNIEEALLLNI